MKQSKTLSNGHYRTWKSGKHWLYAASALTVLAAGVSFGLNAQAATAVARPTVATVASTDPTASSAAVSSSVASSADSTAVTSSAVSSALSSSASSAQAEAAAPSSTDSSLSAVSATPSATPSTLQSSEAPLIAAKVLTAALSPKLSTVAAASPVSVANLNDTNDLSLNSIKDQLEAQNATISYPSQTVNLSKVNTETWAGYGSVGETFDISTLLGYWTDANGNSIDLSNGVVAEVFSPSNTEVGLVGTTFTPTENGIYTVNFSYADKSTGVLITNDAPVIVSTSSASDQTTLYYDQAAMSGYMGSSVNLNSNFVSATDFYGNSINLTNGVSASVTDPNGNSVKLTNDTFTPTMTGTYTATFSYAYPKSVGNYTETLGWEIQVTDSSKITQSQTDSVNDVNMLEINQAADLSLDLTTASAAAKSTASYANDALGDTFLSPAAKPYYIQASTAAVVAQADYLTVSNAFDDFINNTENYSKDSTVAISATKDALNEEGVASTSASEADEIAGILSAKETQDFVNSITSGINNGMQESQEIETSQQLEELEVNTLGDEFQTYLEEAQVEAMGGEIKADILSNPSINNLLISAISDVTQISNMNSLYSEESNLLSELNAARTSSMVSLSTTAGSTDGNPLSAVYENALLDSVAEYRADSLVSVGSLDSHSDESLAMSAFGIPEDAYLTTSPLAQSELSATGEVSYNGPENLASFAITVADSAEASSLASNFSYAESFYASIYSSEVSASLITNNPVYSVADPVISWDNESTPDSTGSYVDDAGHFLNDMNSFADLVGIAVAESETSSQSNGETLYTIHYVTALEMGYAPSASSATSALQDSISVLSINESSAVSAAVDLATSIAASVVQNSATSISSEVASDLSSLGNSSVNLSCAQSANSMASFTLSQASSILPTGNYKLVFAEVQEAYSYATLASSYISDLLNTSSNNSSESSSSSSSNSNSNSGSSSGAANGSSTLPANGTYSVQVENGIGNGKSITVVISNGLATGNFIDQYGNNVNFALNGTTDNGRGDISGQGTYMVTYPNGRQVSGTAWLNIYSDNPSLDNITLFAANISGSVSSNQPVPILYGTTGGSTGASLEFTDTQTGDWIKVIGTGNDYDLSNMVFTYTDTVTGVTGTLKYTPSIGVNGTGINLVATRDSFDDTNTGASQANRSNTKSVTPTYTSQTSLPDTGDSNDNSDLSFMYTGFAVLALASMVYGMKRKYKVVYKKAK